MSEGRQEVSYEEWERVVPLVIRRDALWKMEDH
jgi:hypothetical protein